MSAIIFDHVSFAYQQKKIFTDFNAQIQTGDFVGVFGPNGAGKSTFFKVILGLLPLRAGTITTATQRFAIGYMPQNRQVNVNGNLSGKARLLACAQGCKWGLPTNSSLAEIEKLIHLVEAESYSNRPFRQLSGGEKQRLLFAQALLNNPGILLLDEPLLNLDPYHQEKMIELIARIQKKLSVTILLSSHAINPLLPYMNKVIYMAQGNAAIGSVNEVINAKKLSELYGYPVEVICHHERLFILGQGTEVLDYDSHH